MRPPLAQLAALAALLCLALPAAAGLPSDIPFKQSTPEEDGLIYRAILSFVVAGAAAWGLAWCIKRYLPRLGAKMGRRIGTQRQLERLELLRIGARSTLVRVRWGEEELLIGENENSVTLLGRKAWQEEPPATAQNASEGNTL
jgi:flagellar biogenesis protein FliO